MADYDVSIAEVHYRIIRVSADNEEGAIASAKVISEDIGDDWYVEYSHTMDQEFWNVEKIKD